MTKRPTGRLRQNGYSTILGHPNARLLLVRVGDIYMATRLIWIALVAPWLTPIASSSDPFLDITAWKLQLNRGARATMTAVDGQAGVAKAVRIDIESLFKPGDRHVATNVHLRWEPVGLKSGKRYLLRAWVMARSKRPFMLRINSLDHGRSIRGAAKTFAATKVWQPYWITFTAQAAAKVRLQVVAGQTKEPLWVAAPFFSEIPSPPALAPADHLWGNGIFAQKPKWQRSGDDLWLAVPLPRAFRLDLASQANRVLSGSLLFALEGSRAPLVLSIRDRTMQLRRGDAILSRATLTGPVSSGLRLTVLRFDTELRVLHLAVPTLSATVPESIERVGLRGLARQELATFDGRELRPKQHHCHVKEAMDMTDPETGVTIHRLTHSPRHDKHAYYDVSPWNPDGAKVVFASALPGERTSQIFIVNSDGSAMEMLAEDGTFGMHTGAFTQWSPDGKGVYYTTRTKQGAATAYLDLATRQRRILHRPSRMVSPDGRRSLYLEQAGDGRNHLGVMNTDGADAHIIAKWDDVMALSPSQDAIKKKPPNLTNCKWSPRGDRVLFGITNERHRPRTVKELYTVNPDGTDLRWLCPYNHHHIWSPDGSGVLFNGKRGMMFINADGTNMRRVCAIAAGHPSFSPDGRYIVTDAYKKHLIMIDAQTGEARWLVNVPSTLGYTHESGTHPHPCWSPDGRQILYDSDQSGTCQLYVLDVPPFSSLPKIELAPGK